MKIFNVYYTFLASLSPLSPHFTLSSLTSTSLSPHTLLSPHSGSLSHPTILPFPSNHFPHSHLPIFPHSHLTLSFSLPPHSLSSHSLSPTHTHSFSLTSLPHLTSLSHLTLPSFFLSPHSPHSLSPHLILLSLSPTLSPYSPSQFSLSPLSLNSLSSLFLSHSNLYLTSLS